MDNLEEVKKLKQLLDEGIIDENDFKRKKAQLLGLPIEKVVEKAEDVHIDKAENVNSKTLEDYEKELLKQSKMEKIDDYYEREKIRARAELEAEAEMRSKRRLEQKEVIDKGANKVKRIVKWILAIFLWVFAITSFTVTEVTLMYIPIGILTFVLGCMACPKITDITQKYEAYTMHKTAIVWITIIITLVISGIASSQIRAKVDAENSNVTSINNEINNN